MKLLYSKKKIHERVKELGKQISLDHVDGNMIIVPILKGAVIFACDLMREIEPLTENQKKILDSQENLDDSEFQDHDEFLAELKKEYEL